MSMITLACTHTNISLNSHKPGDLLAACAARRAEILAKFQSLQEEIIQLRDTAVVSREVSARLVARALALEEKMNRLAAEIEKLDGRVADDKTPRRSAGHRSLDAEADNDRVVDADGCEGLHALLHSERSPGKSWVA